MLVDNRDLAADSILETMEPYVGSRYIEPLPEVEFGWSYQYSYGYADTGLSRIPAELIAIAEQMAVNAANMIDAMIHEAFSGKGE